MMGSSSARLRRERVPDCTVTSSTCLVRRRLRASVAVPRRVRHRVQGADGRPVWTGDRRDGGRRDVAADVRTASCRRGRSTRGGPGLPGRSCRTASTSGRRPVSRYRRARRAAAVTVVQARVSLALAAVAKAFAVATVPVVCAVPDAHVAALVRRAGRRVRGRRDDCAPAVCRARPRGSRGQLLRAGDAPPRDREPRRVAFARRRPARAVRRTHRQREPRLARSRGRLPDGAGRCDGHRRARGPRRGRSVVCEGPGKPAPIRRRVRGVAGRLRRVRQGALAAVSRVAPPGCAAWSPAAVASLRPVSWFLRSS